MGDKDLLHFTFPADGMSQINVPHQLLCDRTSALCDPSLSKQRSHRTHNSEWIRTVVLVKPLILNTDKCLFYQFWNLIRSQINNIFIILQQCDPIAIGIIDFPHLPGLKITGR